MPQRRALAVLLALVVLLADQLSKNWLLHQPGAAQGLPLLPGLMNLRLVWNNGAAFSLFREGAHEVLGEAHEAHHDGLQPGDAPRLRGRRHPGTEGGLAATVTLTWIVYDRAF